MVELKEDRLEVGGRQVRVLTGGIGLPVVFFDSALGTPAEEWGLVAPAIAERTRLILWDRPGVGRSAGPVLGPGEFPLVAAELLTALQSGPAVVVGHSLGGLNVLCLTLSRPDLVAGAVLVEPSHPEQDQRMRYPPDGGDPPIQAARWLGAAPAWAMRIVGGGLSMAERTLGRSLPPRARLLAEVGGVMVGRLDAVTAEYSSWAERLAEARKLVASRPFPELPIVVLTGSRNFSKDPKLAAMWDEMHEELASLSPHGRHERIDCGHDVPFAKPIAVTAAITDVWSRCDHGTT